MNSSSIYSSSYYNPLSYSTQISRHSLPPSGLILGIPWRTTQRRKDGEGHILSPPFNMLPTIHTYLRSTETRQSQMMLQLGAIFPISELPRSSFLPFLWGRHQGRQFVVVEPPHGKVVEREVCTEREADTQLMMSVVQSPDSHKIFLVLCRDISISESSAY